MTMATPVEEVTIIALGKKKTLTGKILMIYWEKTLLKSSGKQPKD